MPSNVEILKMRVGN